MSCVTSIFPRGLQPGVKVKDAPDLNAKMEESSIAPPEPAEVTEVTEVTQSLKF